jgi:uncharacterized membrane protein HdeD (DUF308 family)
MPTLEANLEEHVLRPIAKATWWSILVRGALAILFGILVLGNPGIGLTALVLTFGVYAAIDGVAALATAIGHGRAGQSWGWYLVEGLVSLAVAALAFARPGVTILAIVLLIAFRAIALGLFELGGAVAGSVGGQAIEHRWLLAITGLVSLVFGVLLIAEPLVGSVALMWAVGVYALVFGIMLVVVGIRALVATSRADKESSYMPPTGLPGRGRMVAT